jgi:hypothetical protein
MIAPVSMGSEVIEIILSYYEVPYMIPYYDELSFKLMMQFEVICEKRQELLDWLRMSGPSVLFRRWLPSHPILKRICTVCPIRAPCGISEEINENCCTTN